MELAFPTPFQSPLSPPQPFVLSLTISPSFKSEGEGGEGKHRAQTPCMSKSFSPLSKATLGVGGKKFPQTVIPFPLPPHTPLGPLEKQSLRFL